MVLSVQATTIIGKRRGEDMGAIIYLALAYWAAGKTIYKNKIQIGTIQGIFLQRLVLGALLGFILIPIAIIMMIFSILGYSNE